MNRWQLWRIRSNFPRQGEAGLTHQLRGIRSNRGHTQQTREPVARLYRERYSDYGPTLFAEMLVKHHELAIGVETLR